MKRLLLILMVSIPILVFGQGNMDFEGETGLTGSYTANSFTENGIEYSYNNSRNEGEYGIEGNGLTFQNNTSYLEWEVTNGIGELSFEYRKAFTGASNRKIQVFVNDEAIGDTGNFGSGSGEQITIYNSTFAIDEDGSTTIRIANAGAQVTIDNISWTAYEEGGGTDPDPICEAPGNLDASAITETSATISWEGDADEYIVSYGSEEFTVATTSIDLEDLTAGTTYEVEITSVCDGENGESASISFETEEETTPPVTGEFCFAEDFEEIINGDNITTGGSGAQWSGNDQFPTVEKAYQAGGAVKLGTGSAIGFIQSSTLDGVSGDIEVTILVKGWTNIEGDLIVNIDGQEETLTYSATMNDAFEEVTASFSNVSGGAQLKIQTSAKRAFIDNITISCEDDGGTTDPEPCLAPTDLSVSNITETSATISWEGDADEYIVSHGSEEFTVANTSIDLEDLTAGTAYEVEITSVCNGENGESASISFETEGESTPPVTGEFCFAEDFEEIDAGNNTTTGGSNAQWPGNDQFPTIERAYKAGGAVRIGVGQNSGFIQSSTLDGVSGDIEVIISVKGWVNVEGDLIVSIDGQEETLTYSATMNDAFEEVTASFSNVSAGAQLKIQTSAKRAFIDNITISCEDDGGTTDPEPCLVPTDINFVEITENSVTVSWNAGGNESAWAPAYGYEGWDGHEEQLIESEVTDDMVVTFSNLEPNTSYDFYIYSICGDEEMMSEIIGPFSFTTLGAVEEFDCEDLQANIGDVCYDEEGNEGFVTEDCDCFVETELCDDPTNIVFSTDDDDYDFQLSFDGGDAEMWLVMVVVEGGDPENLNDIWDGSIIEENEMDVWAGTLDPGNWDIYLLSLCDNNEGNWILVGTVEIESCAELPSNVQTTQNDDGTITVSWDPVTGDWDFFVLNAGDNPYLDYEVYYDNFIDSNPITIPANALEPGSYDMYIDTYCDDGEWAGLAGPFTFTIEEEVDEPCESPLGIAVNNVTEDGAEITWSAANEGDDTWEISLTTGGQSADQGITAVVTGTPSYEATGLDADTTYLVYLRTICSDEDSSEWAYNGEFTTLEAVEIFDCEDLQANIGDVCYDEEGNEGIVTEDCDCFVEIEDECESPLGITVNNVTEDSAEITWSAANEGDDTWEISLTTGGQSADQGITAVVTGTPSYEATGLDADTTYSVYLRTICSDEDSSEWAYNGEFTTLEAVEIFDCEDLQANIGDVCYDDDGNEGVITEDCDCFVEIEDECEAPSADDNNIFISKIHIDGIGVDIDNDYYDLDYTSSAKSAGGYAVVDSPEFTIYPNYNGSYSVSSGPAGNGGAYYYAVWIDFNGDGCFDEDEQVIWSDGAITNDQFDNEDVPSSFSALAPGTYTARIRNSMQSWPSAHGAGDGEALDFTLHIVSEDEAEHILGIDNQVFNNFSFYPNPVQHQLNLKAGNSIEQVEVYNLLGQKVISVQPNTLETIIDTDRLQAGVYMMSVMIDGSQKTYKIVKK